MKITMKKYRNDDFDFISAIAKEEIGAYHPDQNFLDTDIKKRLNKNKTFVIYNKNRRVGFISYRVTLSVLYPFMQNKRLLLDLIGFEKRYQQHGIGRKVIGWLEQEAKNMKMQSIYGYVIKNNQRAVKVWGNLGCRVVGEVKNHFIMEKKIEE